LPLLLLSLLLLPSPFLFACHSERSEEPPHFAFAFAFAFVLDLILLLLLVFAVAF
jgi:hypothetical protein